MLSVNIVRQSEKNSVNMKISKLHHKPGPSEPMLAFVKSTRAWAPPVIAKRDFLVACTDGIFDLAIGHAVLLIDMLIYA